MLSVIQHHFLSGRICFQGFSCLKNCITRTSQTPVKLGPACPSGIKPFSTLISSNLSRNGTIIQAVKITQSQGTSSLFTSSGRQVLRQRRLPFELDGNVKHDVLVFSYKNDRLYKMISVFGFVQFLFWCNMAAFCYGTPNIKEMKSDERLGKDSWWSMVAKVQSKYKIPIAGLSLVMGVVVMVFSFLYPMRTIKQLSLLKGGRLVRLTTYSYLGQTRQLTIPLDHVHSMHSRLSKGSEMSLKLKGHKFYYQMDKKNGKFIEPEIFDYVIGLKRL